MTEFAWFLLAVNILLFLFAAYLRWYFYGISFRAALQQTAQSIVQFWIDLLSGKPPRWM